MAYSHSAECKKVDKATITVTAKDKAAFEKVVDSYANEEDMYLDLITNYDGHREITMPAVDDCPAFEVLIEYHDGS